MPGRTLPTISTRALAIHDSAKSCWVTVGANIYDVTSFLDDHPGGGDLILAYGGKDVSKIMGDEVSHVHSEAAHEILNEYMIGSVAHESTVQTTVEHDSPKDIVPMSPKAVDVVAVNMELATATDPFGAKDLTKETGIHADFQTHRFLDLSKPLLAQVWNGGFSKDFYFEQVHRPRYYCKGESAPLFGNFLEPLSMTAWYVVPLVWLAPLIWGTLLANQGMPSKIRTTEYVSFGLVLWTLLEYGLHRALHRMDCYIPDNRIGITIHFLLHGLHHYLPMDKYRMATPPSVVIFLAAPLYRLAHLLFYWDWHAATAVFCGGFYGYICYEMTHYFLHCKTLPPYYRDLKQYHLRHHYAEYENGFGVTSRFWDRVFGTELSTPRAAKAA